MVMQTYESNQPGTFQEQSGNMEPEFSKRIAPSKLPEAKGMRYVSDRLYLISMADSEFYAGTNND